MNTTAKCTLTSLFFAASCLVCVAATNAADLLGKRAAGWAPSNNSQPQVQQQAIRRPIVQNPVVQQPIQHAGGGPRLLTVQPRNQNTVESERAPHTPTRQPGGGLVARQTMVATVEFDVFTADGRHMNFKRNYPTHTLNEATGQMVPVNWQNDLNYHLNWMRQRGHQVAEQVINNTPTTVIDRAPGMDAGPTN